MSKRYVCIHGHFYQPPRANAWLEAIEAQDSAHPYHDWNERIAAECYAANAASRILDEKGYIIDIVNNYTRMSFNFGPTLLSWLEDHNVDTYQSILSADKISAKRFHGHGSAMAQAYNHMIMPLANSRDKETQIQWGISDFEYRFGRYPEGMWLPETAVDTETLEVLARHEIAFTLLSPWQAAAVRPEKGGDWRDVRDGTIDTTRAYRVHLPSGRTIAVFFYHGQLSHAVAFEQLPAYGDYFFTRLLEVFRKNDSTPQLVHVCSDGETYGHHQYQGDKGLAYVLHRIDEDAKIKLINYGAFLEKFPPSEQVRIKENTSWSCPHGIERWRNDCGCNSSGKPKWHQKWRGPLRETLDWLRDILIPEYQTAAKQYFKSPWQARNQYIEVVLNRDSGTMERFFQRNCLRSLSPSEQIYTLKLLELQRNAMLMYTSCGWFFDDISGIETVQIIQYAGRVLQLAGTLFKQHLERSFMDKLALAPSNIAKHGNGRRIYEKWVQPSAVSLAEVGAHFAISSLFKDYGEHNALYSFTVDRRAYRHWQAGRAKLAVGRVTVTSQITWESGDFCFAVLHFGDHNISCGLKGDGDPGTYQGMQQALVNAFEQADFPAVVHILDQYFHSPLYSMKSLFRDDQRAILEPILQARVNDAISVYRAVYEPNVPLMRFLKGTNSLTPRALSIAGDLVLNHNLQQELAEDYLNHDKIRDLMEQAQLAQIPLNEGTLEFTLRMNIERQNELFEADPTDYDVLDGLVGAVELVYDLPFDVRLRKVQDAHFKIGRRHRGEYLRRMKKGDSEAARWLARFDELGEKLLIRPWTKPETIEM